MSTQMNNVIADYFKTQPIQRAWIFGSFARGEETDTSDVDILVTLVPNSRMGLEFFRMIVDLEGLLNRPVDLVVDGNILPFAKESVEHDKLLVYERAS